MRHSLRLLTAGLSIIAVEAPAHGQVRHFQIAPGRLDAVLQAFASQTGAPLVYRSDDVRDVRSPGVAGQLVPVKALGKLLRGTGLTFRKDPTGAIAVFPAKNQSTDAPVDFGATSAGETIVVTGTRIRQPNHQVHTIASPPKSATVTTAIFGDAFFRTGQVAAGDILNDLPTLRSTLAQSNSSRIDMGAGLNMLDLRGLGLERTLVLQNGRRHVAAAAFSSGVDVNTMPIALIDRVDIVSGASSAVYGSDAIAGVVNFILKRDFSGAEVRAQTAISRHGDGGEKFYSATVGTKLGSGAGNITGSFEYARRDDWYASARSSFRDLASYVRVDYDEPGTPNGSDGDPDRVLVRDVRSLTISNGGTFIAGPPDPDGNLAAYLFQPDGTMLRQSGDRVGLPPFSYYKGGDGSNLREGKLFGLAPQLERLSANLFARYSLSQFAEPFVEAKFVRVRSKGSSVGSFFTGDVWGPRERYRTDNPFLHPESRAFIRGALGLAEGHERAFYFRRNFAELGPVTQDNRRETYRALGGVRGVLGDRWSYEASVNVARSSTHSQTTGNVNVQRFLLSIDAVRDPGTGNIVCRAKIDPLAANIYEGAVDAQAAESRLARDVAACVPLNPFGEGNISPAAKEYIDAGSWSRASVTQSVLNAFVTGDSADWLQLPGGPIRMVFGAELRRETAARVKDELVRLGITHATPAPPFQPPRLAVGELFGEVQLPLLQNRPFLHELTLSGAGRIADYRGRIGKVFVWNANASWAPVQGIFLRGSLSQAIRAPNLVESHLPSAQNYSNTFIEDPCSVQKIGAGSATRPSNCAADGVPDGFHFGYSTTFPYISAGNSDLRPEQSRTFALGAVIEPRLLPGLSLAVDYHDVTVTNVIATPTAQSALNSCYDSETIENEFCRLFDRHRGREPGPKMERTGQILHNSLRLIPVNYAALRVRGLDLQLSYNRPLGGGGELRSRLIYALALQNDAFMIPHDPSRKDQRLIELGNPKHRLTWETSLRRGIVKLDYELRYFSKMSVGAIEDIRSIQGRPPEDADAFDRRYFRGAAYQSLRLAVSALPKSDLYLGIDNLTDRLPPPTVTGVADEGAIYGTAGRLFYVGAVARY